MRVALYVRRSTDEVLQRESLAAQEEVLSKYAIEHELEVVQTFRDSASGRSIRGRRAFCELIDLVASGPSFEAVLVRDVSRWGRFPNCDESAYWDFFFQIHGVKVLYVEEGFSDDGTPYANLMKSLKRIIAAEFSQEKARLIQFADYRNVRAGFRLGGDPPYGFRRALVNRSGEVVQVLKRGERKVINDHRIKLVVGDPQQVQVVQRIFREFVGGLRVGQIAKGLNQDGIQSATGGRWKDGTLRRMLTNSIPHEC